MRYSNPNKPINDKLSNNCNIKIIGWNARSIRERVRNEFMWHIITEQNPDIMIIVETWMNEEIKVLNTKYKVIQTKKQNFQGVSIISKDFDIKIE